ncbi:MAG: ABC-2 transporter permease [Clostridiales bacterium]|nr:ABC-2 transporter permease [Clostridiales bacterium]
MKGLIIKDFINLKQQLKITIILFIFYLLFGIITQSTSMFYMVLVLYSMMIPLSIFSYDEKAKWDRYALTLPVSRRDLVVSKYLVYLIVNCVLSILAFVPSVATGMPLLESFSMVLSVVCIGWIYVSVSYPILFKFGVEKSRFVIMIMSVISMIAFTAGSDLINSLSISLPNIVMYIASPILSIVIIAASMMISFRIMAKKEF